jgi:hypothetical protein
VQVRGQHSTTAYLHIHIIDIFLDISTRNHIRIMLSRSPTKVTLTQADIAAFEQRKAASDAMKSQQQFDSSQDTTESLLENDDSPAAGVRANAARQKKAREQRMGLH